MTRGTVPWVAARAADRSPEAVLRARLSAAFRRACAAVGSPHVVCNNAGVMELPDFRRVIDINLTAVVHGSMLAADAMQRAGHGGVIVNVASMAGIAPLWTAPVYSATKHGVVGFTRAMAEALRYAAGGDAAALIRMNCLCPSFVATPMVSTAMRESETFAEIVRAAGPLLQPRTPVCGAPTLRGADAHADAGARAGRVADAFVQLVEDERHVGSVMRVTGARGIELQRYSRPTPSPPPARL